MSENSVKLPKRKRLSKALCRAISREVVAEGKSYAEVGRKYGKSRERIRQIVKKEHPEYNGKRTETVKYGNCVKCGKVRYRRLSPDRTTHRFFGDEDELCGRCRVEKYRRKITMKCKSCKKKRKESIGWVVAMIREREKRGGIDPVKIDKEKMTGTYTCRNCYISLLWRIGEIRRKDGQSQVRTRCIGCGKEDRRYLYVIGKTRCRYLPEEDLYETICRKCFLNRSNVDLSALLKKRKRGLNPPVKTRCVVCGKTGKRYLYDINRTCNRHLPEENIYEVYCSDCYRVRKEIKLPPLPRPKGRKKIKKAR